MQSEHPERTALNTIATVAKSLGIAVLSLVLGATLCLGLLLGGTALAAG